VITLATLAGACTASEPVDLQGLGLEIGVDIQAGESFEVTVPMEADTSVAVVSAPKGVTASISEPADGESMQLSVSVAPDTPAGDYIVLLRAERGGEGAELEWPFGVVVAEAPAPSEVAPGPDAVRDQVVAAVVARDGEALRSLWPSSAWEAFGPDVLESFTPSAELAPCERLSDDRAHCYVFEADFPRVLALTLETNDVSGWTIAAVSLESTN
jgi:hypothetical protein